MKSKGRIKSSRHCEERRDESIQSHKKFDLVFCDSGLLRYARNDGWKSCYKILSIVFLGLLTACAGGGGRHAPTPSAPAAQSGGGYYKVGKPYQIKGTWYYPKEDYSYDETGIASWYGDDFHQFQTANGETYNKNELTAAHPTLPMPSLARVTNLENGRSIVVRINDRGPFSGARLIDVSQRAAQLLGFEQKGTAKVRVQVLADESKAIADAMRTYGGTAAGGGTPPQTTQAVAQVASAPQVASSNASVEVMPLDSAVPPSSGSLSQPTAASSPVLPTSQSLTMANVHPVAEYVQLPVTGGQHNIYIQAGAFTQRNNAERMKHLLSHWGKTSVAQAQVKGVQYYRVRVGPVATVAEADKLLKKVQTSQGAGGARIVVD